VEVKQMDLSQMYNNSAMLHNTFVAYANQSNDPAEKQKFKQLAEEQLSISNKLKPQPK
jgi:hypothetical protein